MTAVVSFVLAAVLAGPAGAFQDDADAPETPTEETTDADEPSPADEARDEQLREGATVYAQICASCHQAGGEGLEGQFPPLKDNPNVDDADYLADVIANGRQGEIVVAGVVYNGVMPSFSTLNEDDTAAVIAFIQNDFVAPPLEAAAPLGPVAGTELPALTNMTYFVTLAMVAGLIGLVLAPRILSENSRLNTPWLDAWLKTAVIVSGVLFFTVIVPDWAIKNEYVTDLSRFAQDLIGVSLWLFGMIVVMWSLWYAHRRSRI